MNDKKQAVPKKGDVQVKAEAVPFSIPPIKTPPVSNSPVPTEHKK